MSSPRTASAAEYTVVDLRRKTIGVSGAAPSAQIMVNGRVFDLATIEQMRKWARALLNWDLRASGVPAPVANVIARASPSMVSTARHLSEVERAQVDADEKSFSFFHNRAKTRREIERAVRKDPEQAAVVLDRVLDHLTSPTSAK